MTRRLVLVQGDRRAWLDTAVRESKDRRGSFDILLVDTDRESYEERFSGDLALAGATFVDVSLHAAGADASVRELVPPFVRDIASTPAPGGGRLADRLETRCGNWWWLLDLAEKSPFRGTLVRRLHVLALMREALTAGKYDEIWLDVADGALADAILHADSSRPRVGYVSAVVGSQAEATARPAWGRYWMYAVGHAVRWLASTVVLGRRAARDSVSGRVCFFTVFPQWWLSAFTPRAEDRFFPPLPDSIDGRRPAYFAWVNLGMADLWRRRAMLRNMAAGGDWMWVHSHIGIMEAASLVSPRAFARLRAFWRDCVTSLNPPFCGFNVRALVLREIRRSLGSGELPRNRMLLAAARGFSALQPRAIVFRDECQPIERAVTLGCRAGTASIGIRHIALDRNYLPLRFAAGELQRSLDGSDSLAPPLPDVLLAIGEVCARLPVSQGFPSERVLICGPVRHGTLVRRLANPPSRAGVRERLGLVTGQPLLFVGTSVSQNESDALLALLRDAGEVIGSARMVIRLHPAGKVRQDLLDSLLTAGRAVMCPDGPLYDYLGASDAMITPGSAIAFEGIALGVMPIVFEWPGGFNAHSFADYADVCFVVRDTAGMESALRSVLGEDGDAAARRARWPALMSAIYTDLDTHPTTQLAQALEAAVTRRRIVA